MAASISLQVISIYFFKIYNSKLEARGKQLLSKTKSIVKLVEIKKGKYLRIWRFRNPRTQNFIFKQNHITGFTHSISNNNILTALSTDQSPLFISFSNDNSDKNGHCFWKFNNSLVFDEVYVENMKKSIQNSIIQTNL